MGRNTRTLEFIDNLPETYIRCIERIIASKENQRMVLEFENENSEIAKILKENFREINNVLLYDQGRPESNSFDFNDCLHIKIYTQEDPDTLSKHLIKLVSNENIHVIAPITKRYSKNLPVFLISIPKSGTHLLTRLFHLFGYQEGIVCPDLPRANHWYCISGDTTHVTPQSFGIDPTLRNPSGEMIHPYSRTGRNGALIHPFLHSPAVFIYRHPADILVSESHYYSSPYTTIFSSYLSELDPISRTRVLIDDPSVFGSISDRILPFAGWFNTLNVASVSFEELVGESGGGSRILQLNSIWALQLKLQISGSPENFADQLFDKNSPTFRQGKIGSHILELPDDIKERFQVVMDKSLNVFGYKMGEGFPDLPLLKKRMEREMVLLPTNDNSNTPHLLKEDFYGYNILTFRNKFYALPRELGPVDFACIKDYGSIGILEDDALHLLDIKVLIAQNKESILDKSANFKERLIKCLKNF